MQVLFRLSSGVDVNPPSGIPHKEITESRVVIQNLRASDADGVRIERLLVREAMYLLRRGEGWELCPLLGCAQI